MATAKDVMGGGFSAGQAQAISGTTALTITAAGTTLATATALTASNNFVSTATSGQGVSLYNGVIGDEVFVYNGSGNAIVVYPPTSSQKINQLAAGGGVNLPNATLLAVQKWSSTQWVAMISA